MWCWWCFNEVNNTVRLTSLAAAHFTSQWFVLFDFLYFYKCELKKKIHHVALNCHLIRPACIVTVASLCMWLYDIIVRCCFFVVSSDYFRYVQKIYDFSVSSYTSHFSIPANFKGTSSVNVSDVSCLKDLARKASVNFFSYTPFYSLYRRKIEILVNTLNCCL